MLYTVKINDDVNINMTCLQGEVDMSYADVVARLGNPTSDGDGYKVDAEWSMEFNNGEDEPVVASVYNYKDGPNYCGLGSIESLRDWHIGGHGPEAVELVTALLRGDSKIQIVS